MAFKRAAIGNMYFINTTHLECKNSIELLATSKKIISIQKYISFTFESSPLNNIELPPKVCLQV